MKRYQSTVRNRQGRIRRRTTAALLAAFLLLIPVGCGSVSSNESGSSQEIALDSSEEMKDAGAAAGVEAPYASQNVSAEMSEETQTDNSRGDMPNGRKLIKTVSMDTETEDYDGLLVKIKESVEEQGGYIENMDSCNGSYYNPGTLRNASMTIRIPADRLDGFTERIAGMSNVTNRSENVQDVTLQYVDLESHTEALETEQERLLTLLEQAESVEDIITIEGRLSEVRYQLENIKSQLRVMDNEIDYGTIYLYISEVKLLTPAADLSVGERIGSGFQRSLHDIAEGLKEFGIYLLIHLPYLVLFVFVIGAGFVIAWGITRHRKKKTKKRIQKGGVPAEQDGGGISAGKENEDKNEGKS